MKILALIVAFSATTASQSSTQSIAGTWAAEFEGRTYVRLELSTASGSLAGRITLGNVEFDEAGAVRRAGDPPRELKPISDVEQRQSTVTFSVAGGDEPDRFEMKLIGPGTAELRLLISDELRTELVAGSIPLPGPIPLTKR